MMLRPRPEDDYFSDNGTAGVEAREMRSDGEHRGRTMLMSLDSGAMWVISIPGGDRAELAFLETELGRTDSTYKYHCTCI